MNKNVSDPTICYICLEQYSLLNKPLILMCGHTFCENCLKIIWSKRKEIPCSYCKSITTAERVEDIIINYSTLNTIEYITSIKLSSGQAITPVRKPSSSLNVTNSTKKLESNDQVSSMTQKFSTVISNFVTHNCYNKDNFHFTEDKILQLKICINCFSLHCPDCIMPIPQIKEDEINKLKCVYCEYLHYKSKDFIYDGETLNVVSKQDRKAINKQGNKFFLESRHKVSLKESYLESYDDYVGSCFEKFKNEELIKFDKLNNMYSEYMLSSSEESLKQLLEDEINKAKKRFSELAIKVKKEEEFSIIRMNMAFERKIQDFFVLSKEQKGLLLETQRFSNVITENANYKKFSSRQKVTANKIYNFPYLIYEIKEFSNEAEARIEAFKEVSSLKTFQNFSLSKEKEGLFLIELRESLLNCVRINSVI